MLEAARELHKYFHDAKEVLAMIQEKENLLTDDLGRDLNSLHQLQVVHLGFEADLAPLGNQVKIKNYQSIFIVTNKENNFNNLQ